MQNLRRRAFGLVAMIPALGAGGPEFKSRIAPNFYQNQISPINRIIIWSLVFLSQIPYFCKVLFWQTSIPEVMNSATAISGLAKYALLICWHQWFVFCFGNFYLRSSRFVVFGQFCFIAFENEYSYYYNYI